MNQQAKHSVPHYLIDDLVSLGWEPKFEYMEGNTGCFTRIYDEKMVTIFPNLTVPLNGIPAEYRFTPRLAIGTTWFKTVYQLISGDKLLEYPGFHYLPEILYFQNPKYSRSFIKDASDYVIEWSINIDIRDALLSTAKIPDGQGYPNNSFAYITAHAILGNIDELEKLSNQISSDIERPIVTYVKANHLKNAIECCKYPERYDLPASLVSYLRGINT